MTSAPFRATTSPSIAGHNNKEKQKNRSRMKNLVKEGNELLQSDAITSIKQHELKRN